MTKPGKIKKSLIASFWDGIFSSCTAGLTADYITPFALVLKATTSQIGVLSALPSLVSSLAQLKTEDLTEKLKSRAKVVSIFIFLHACAMIPVIFLPYLVTERRVELLIILVTLFTSLGGVAGPAWLSLLVEYIPHKKRGRYFGWRSRILGIVTVLCSLAAGLTLHLAKDNALKGFMAIFIAAVVCRFVSWYYLTRMYEPRYKSAGDSYFSFLDFIRRARESNFVKFIFFVSSFIFCVNIASPFFAVFMLRDLKFDYLTYTLLTVTVTITQICAFNRWGTHADRVGNIRIIKFTSVFIATLPLWWVISRNPLVLVFAQIVSGFAWAGFNLCSVNFIHDAVTPQKRVRCIAFYGAFIGVATCLGSLSGGFLSKYVPELFGHRLLCLFLLSSVLRFSAIFIFSGRIKEVRHAEHMTDRDLFLGVTGIIKQGDET